MQAFHAERRLSLARADAERRRNDRVDVSVLDDERSSREVGVQIELEMAQNPAAEIGTKATERKRIVDRLVAIVWGEPAVRLKQQTNLQPVVTVERLDGKAALPGS